jgi:hypothetical protein
VTQNEDPVDLKASQPQPGAADLSSSDAGGAGAAQDGAGAAMATSPDAGAPKAKSEDRIGQIVQDAADQDANGKGTIAVAPRKVRTMVVKPDGSLVPSDDPAPQKLAAQQQPAPEGGQAPTRPAGAAVSSATYDTASAAPADGGNAVSALPPANAAKPSTDQTADLAAADQTAPAKPAKARQSLTTPSVVPVAPQRPSDQPVDIVGEVKPDQVASINPSPSAAQSGSWSVQIASQPTAESAQAAYNDLAKRYAGVLNGRGVSIVKADLAGKGTFYRVRVPAQSRNDAISLCTAYKAAGGNCFVSK